MQHPCGTAKDQLRAVILNSGNANACTRVRGIADAKRMTVATAVGLKCKPEEVLACSTGRIKVPSPIRKVSRGIRAGELEKLNKEGVIRAGMIPKCRSAASALAQGLKKVEFVDGRVARTLTKVVKGEKKAGAILTM